MKTYVYAECRTNLAPDSVAEDGEIVTSGGRGAAEALREILVGAGYDVPAPEHMGDHGWDLNIRVSGRRIWLEVQMDSDEFILQVEAMLGFMDWFRRPDFGYFGDFLAKLNDGLRRDERFTQVHWFRTERHAPAGAPLDDPLKATA